MASILYIATSNPGKLRDFAAADTVHIPIAPLRGIKDILAPLEDEPPFEGTARLKAIYYSHHAPGEIVIADDSGLEVDALHGDPGVRSARYSDDQNFLVPNCETTGEITLDERNNLCLLHALANTPPPATARYHCVLAAAR